MQLLLLLVLVEGHVAHVVEPHGIATILRAGALFRGAGDAAEATAEALKVVRGLALEALHVLKPALAGVLRRLLLLLRWGGASSAVMVMGGAVGFSL